MWGPTPDGNDGQCGQEDVLSLNTPPGMLSMEHSPVCSIHFEQFHFHEKIRSCCVCEWNSWIDTQVSLSTLTEYRKGFLINWRDVARARVCVIPLVRISLYAKRHSSTTRSIQQFDVLFAITISKTKNEATINETNKKYCSLFGEGENMAHWQLWTVNRERNETKRSRSCQRKAFGRRIRARTIFFSHTHTRMLREHRVLFMSPQCRS